MSRLLQVVVFSNDTTIGDGPVQLNSLTGSINLPRRMAILRRLVEDGYNVCQMAQSLGKLKQPNATGGPLYLFVAPEYLLADSGVRHVVDKVVVGNAQPEDAKEYILRELTKLSADFPDMILVPGSFTWKKPQARTGEAPNEVGTRIKKAIARVERSPLHQDQKLEKLKVLRGQDPTIKAVSVWLAYSTAYVFYKGKIIHKYSKQVDATEISAIESDGGKVIFIPGDRSAYFTVDGIDFALEICGEHAAAVRAHDVKQLVDVHIIVSASVVARTPNYVAKNDGWVIHADAYNIYISQVNRGESVTATDRTAPLNTLNANALGGPYLDEIKEVEAQLLSGLQELDVKYAVPHSAYLKKNKLMVQRATAKIVQQTLVIS